MYMYTYTWYLHCTPPTHGTPTEVHVHVHVCVFQHDCTKSLYTCIVLLICILDIVLSRGNFQFSNPMSIHNGACTCTCRLCTCLGSSVGRAFCLEYRVSWVRVPPEAAHFSRKSDCLGCAVLLCLVCLFDVACFFLSSLI